MKERKNFKPVLALATFVMFFMNLLTPVIVEAKALTKENSITISVERRVLGQEDIVTERQVTLKNTEERTSELFDAVMKELGIGYEHTGALDNAFYISSIDTVDHGPLGEFDHGVVSGWMYSINGDFKNVGMSDSYLKAGDTLRVCYTTKDYAKSVIATDKVHELRKSISDVEALDKNSYTQESFAKLEEALNDAKKFNYSDEEIGQMMSDSLGTGECDTEALISDVDSALSNINIAIDSLEKVQVELPKEDISINLYKMDNKESKDTIYFKEGQESINVLLEQMDSSKDVWLNDEKLTAINDKYVVNLKKGFNIFKIIRWGNPVEVIVPCVELPYTIEGNLVPGEIVKIKFKGLEESVKNNDKYHLEKSQTQYKSDIPGISQIVSQMCEGPNPDREVLGTLQFTIPNDIEPGTYNLTGGSMYHKWGKTSINGDMQGNFSMLPDIKLEIKDGIDESKIQDINLDTWTQFDTVYTTEDKAYVRVNNEAKTVLELTDGTNNIQVDGKDYSIECSKISYEVLNANAITPGSKVKISFNGLKEAFLYISGKYNPNMIKTTYNTDIEGLANVSSEKAGDYSSVNYEKLNYIEFTLPEDVELGEYNLTSGAIYQSWWGKELPGATATNDGGYQRKFSLLPNIKFNVVESAPEDTEAPAITSSLKESQEVNKSDFRFRVLVTDNVDGKVEPIVKYEDKVLNHNGSNWYDIKLSDGENIITVEATDKAGNKVSKKYKVICNVALKEGSSIILDTLSLELDKGQKHQLIAVDADDKRGTSSEPTAKMFYEVIDGNNIVEVSKNGEVTALDYGLAKISVKYPGLKNPAIVAVNVKKASVNTPEIVTDIMNKYDTFYFENETSKYSFNVESKDANETTVKVNGNVVSGENNVYSTPLIEGYNTIEIVAKKGNSENIKLYTVKAKKVTVTIKNLSNEGNEIVQGDKVRVEFKGLETPVPKFLRIYNPKSTRVNYSTNVPGMTDIDGMTSQYDIANKNAIEFTATRAGEFTFSNGAIHEDWWGEELYSEKGIENLPPNLNALVRKGEFSSLPNFTINVKENSAFKDRFNPEVENGDNLKAGQEVIINIPDMVMPEVGRALEAYTKFDTDIKGLEVISSEDAANDATKLKTVKFTLPEDIKPGTYTITNGRIFMEYDNGGALWKDGEFFKGDIPEIEITVKDETPEIPGVSEETKKKLIDGINNASKWTLENVKNPNFEDEWNILGLVRGAIQVPEDYFKTYYNNLVEVVKEKKGELHRSKYTEYSRVIITLSALGKDPTNVGGYNLLEKLYDYNKVSRQGINGIVYALIALDTKNYEAPKGYREKLIEGILSKQLEDGGFALSGQEGDADITSMTLQALAKYKNQENVKEAIDKAGAFLSRTQLSNGGFGGVDGENLESSAQVLVALNALDIELNDTRFVKNNKNLVDVMMEYVLENGGFKHLLSQNEANGMATEQALYALVSLDRELNGKTSLYDMSDVSEDDEDTEEPSIKPEIINNAPQIYANDVEIKVGDSFDPLNKVVATDKEDDDSTLVVKVVENTVDVNKAGEYKVIYSVTDSQGATTTKTILVKVVSGEESEDNNNSNNGNSNNGNSNNGNSNSGNQNGGNTNGNKPSAGKPGLPQTGSEAAIVLSLLGIVSIGAGVSLRRNKK